MVWSALHDSEFLFKVNINGVVVEAVTPVDTLFTTTANGLFQFKKITPGRITLRFSHLAYQEVVKDIVVKPGETTELEIQMLEAPQEIETVTVKGQIPVLTVKGDTLVYNAAAVQTFENDETIKILEQLPGVSASEESVSVMGKEISRTYVDGKLIFGRNPMAALQNLLADDVLKIRVYDEYEDDNPRHKRFLGDEKRRVLDIETKSKLIQAATGHFLASYGADMNQGGRDNNNRYGIGTTANFFSESLLLSANAFFNNINRKSNRISDIIAVKSPKNSYDRTTYVNAGIERSWDSKVSEYSRTTLQASYTYGNDYTRSENASEQIYFPAADYSSARYHAANIYFSHPSGLRFTHDMRFENNASDNYRSYASEMDGGSPVGGQTRNRNKQSKYDLHERLVLFPMNFYIQGEFDLSNNDGSGFRLDSLTSTATQRILQSSSDGLSRKVSAQISKSIMLSDDLTNKLELGYSFVWEKSRKKTIALDLAEAGRAVIDSTNTCNFTNNFNTHKAFIGWGYYIPKLKGNLMIRSTFVSTGINRDERFPDIVPYDKRFNAFLPSIVFTSMRMAKQWSIQYYTSVQLPSIEQLRPRLDDTNPYMLVAGNQRLKQSYTHQLIGQYFILFGKANNNLMVALNVRKTDNMIAYKRTFFAEATDLPEWNYTAPTQSTLTTYENINGRWIACADIKWIRPLNFLKSQLTVNTIFNYDDTPSFVGDLLNRAKSYAPELKLDLRANVSRSFRFSVGTRTSYIYSENNIGQDDKYFQQGVSANTELNIFKRFYLNVTYSLSYYKRFEGNSYDLNNQILNVAIGCKILKRRGDISFTAYDILNRNSGYKTAMYSDYIQNSWTRSFGRYFTFNIAYRFNRTKPGVSNSHIKDGSMEKMG